MKHIILLTLLDRHLKDCAGFTKFLQPAFSAYPCSSDVAYVLHYALDLLLAARTAV